jgi:hypothetical protein
MTAAVDSEAAKLSMLWFDLVIAALWVVLPEDMVSPPRRWSPSGGAGRVDRDREFVKRDPCLGHVRKRRGNGSRCFRDRNGLRKL